MATVPTAQARGIPVEVRTEYQHNDLDREAIEAMITHIFATQEARAVVVRWHRKWTAQFAVPKALGFASTSPEGGGMVLTREQWEERTKP